MKRVILLSLSAIIVVASIFTACSQNKISDDTSTEPDLANAEQVVGFETDENGEDVPVEYVTDKKGNTIAVKLDKDGNKVTNKNGDYVTIKTSYKVETTGTTKATQENTKKLTTTTTAKPTATTDKDTPPTSSKETTSFKGSETVPKTSASGKKVNFSVEDQEIIASMLEVPYLYLSSYENTDGVPIDIACHTAVWMAEHEGSIRTVYPSSPVVLNLFKFYGQTVVNFKTQCNEFAGNGKAPISYQKANDTFEITEYTPKKQTVKITNIEDLGDNNFYKVEGTVSGCNKKSVIAIVQKNKLEPTLGFSIKALKWS